MSNDDSGASMGTRNFNADDYAVVLTCGDKDKYRHSECFASELAPAFLAQGLHVLSLDYLRDVRAVSEAVRDKHCVFFVCFNGFGSELMYAAGTPGVLGSVFEYYGKTLFDFMHDCPVHESMAHQIGSVGEFRRLLCTDYTYAHIARLLGAKNVQAVPSITFANTITEGECPHASRSIDVLLPVGLSRSDEVRERYTYMRNYRDRVFREIFESVVDFSLSDLRIDPLVQVLMACQEAGINADMRDAEVRFLVTSVGDFVKFERRDRLVRALNHLPVTVISDYDVRERYPHTRMNSIGERSFPDLLRTMSDAKCVVCPVQHHTGFHERALAAFTAGAGVIAGPNEILETHFIHGRDMLTYQSEDELADMLESVFDGQLELETMARSGREHALARFPSAAIVETIISGWRRAFSSRRAS
ncbi:glycosyltransferase [Paraburkholderia sp. A1RI-2L]|uniref:glycosyltransferase n=1 Tax=Paraburkholderia sp. A1RI-2L TaxID=3028367 RepID=UPI003B78D8A5